MQAATSYLRSNPFHRKVEFNLQGSFFEYSDRDGDKSFDFAYDYTFLCALQPEMRESWASTYARLLKDDGILMTVVFPITGHNSGPPFALTVNLVRDLLRPHGFKKIFEKNLEAGEAHDGRVGKTTMALWCRRGKDIDESSEYVSFQSFLGTKSANKVHVIIYFFGIYFHIYIYIFVLYCISNQTPCTCRYLLFPTTAKYEELCENAASRTSKSFP